jgi:hypothetical protein
MTKEQIQGLPAEELLNYEFVTQEEMDKLYNRLLEIESSRSELMYELSKLDKLNILIQDEITRRKEMDME